MQKVTLNLSLEDMRRLKWILEVSIVETENAYYCGLNDSLKKVIDYKESILSAIESAIYHAEMSEK